MATGKDQRITITASSGLSEDQVKNMVAEAAANEADDKRKREEIERRNKLDSMCYQLEKTINENKDKLPSSDVATLEGIIAQSKQAVEKQDDALVQESLEKLEKEAHRIASVLYQQAGSSAAPPGAAPPSGDDGSNGAKKRQDVVDAEFEESN
jgi:molecular chaperone DnaK